MTTNCKSNLGPKVRSTHCDRAVQMTLATIPSVPLPPPGGSIPPGLSVCATPKAMGLTCVGLKLRQKFCHFDLFGCDFAFWMRLSIFLSSDEKK